MAIAIRVFLIFALVAVLAGGIAMLGNQLGRKIGRRKMTIFGMRPRHTSIFITTITGSLIAVLTLATAMVASQDVREYVTGVQARVDKLKQRERQLLKRISQLDTEVRRGTIIWNHGERIALITVPAGRSQEEVTRSLGRLIAESNFVSLRKNNTIAVQQNEAPFEIETILLKYSAEDFADWVRNYSHLNESVGLQTVVKQNCFFRDPIPVTVESFSVDLLYKKGDVVFSKEIGAQSMLNDWYDFLRELKEEALRDGMIEINGSLGGGITQETLDDISVSVATYGGRVRLKAIANDDIYESSKLDVSIEVTPVR